MDFSTQDLSSLIKTIRTIAREEALAVLSEKNVEQVLYGTIVSVGSDNKYTVNIYGMKNNYTLLNKSPTTFSVGDCVLIKAINSNLGNAYISAKMG